MEDIILIPQSATQEIQDKRRCGTGRLCEHGGGCLKDVSLQIPPRERELMQAMRRVFDPTGIMNPGKAF